MWVGVWLDMAIADATAVHVTSKNVECIVEICLSAMSDEEVAPAALMLKRGRGRPRKDDMRIVRPPKAVKACVDAVLQVYADDRNRASKEWVEVAPRLVFCTFLHRHFRTRRNLIS